MKKKIFLLITLLGTMVFTSCQDDDVTTPNTTNNNNQTTTTSYAPSSLSGKKIVFSTDTWEMFYFNTTGFTYKYDAGTLTLVGTPKYSYIKTGAKTADLTMEYTLKDFLGSTNYLKSFKFNFTSANTGAFTGNVSLTNPNDPQDSTGWENEGTFTLY